MKESILNCIEIAFKNKVNQYGYSEIDEIVLKGVLSGKRGITTLRNFETPCKPLILLRL